MIGCLQLAAALLLLGAGGAKLRKWRAESKTPEMRKAAPFPGRPFHSRTAERFATLCQSEA